MAPAFAIDTYLIARLKGTPGHRTLRRLYLTLMVATALISLLMPAHVGPQLLGHFGTIHLFSLFPLYIAPSTYLAARRGNIKTHRSNMRGLYIGGILVAGAFALSPGHMPHGWIFG